MASREQGRSHASISSCPQMEHHNYSDGSGGLCVHRGHEHNIGVNVSAAPVA